MFKKRRIFLALVTICVVAVFIVYNLTVQPTAGEVKKFVGFVQSNSHQNDSKKVILFWTNFFGDQYWGGPEEVLRSDYLKLIACPWVDCVFTTNRSYLKDQHEYDAIVFHATQPDWAVEDLPLTRSTHQLYIMASLESPVAHDINCDYDFYNLSMTYRISSDIPWYYGKTVDLASGTQAVAPAFEPNWTKPDDNYFDDDILKSVKNKSKSVAWFVSNCHSESKRQRLAKKLQEFIDLDVYGDCGRLKCEKSSMECYKMLGQDYKFYLSFENSLCIDYITEKVFRPISHNVIPVIYSGAEASRFLPPKSYIDVESFPTVEGLANYLNFLIQNPTEYVKYFWWKKHYQVISDNSVDFCGICEKLNELSMSRKVQSYKCIKNSVKTACRKPKIEF